MLIAHIQLFSIFIERVVKNSRIRSNARATSEVDVYNTSWTNEIKRLRMRILRIHEHARYLLPQCKMLLGALPNEFHHGSSVDIAFF